VSEEMVMLCTPGRDGHLIRVSRSLVRGEDAPDEQTEGPTFKCLEAYLEAGSTSNPSLVAMGEVRGDKGSCLV